jgi:TatD DNase family protein
MLTMAWLISSLRNLFWTLAASSSPSFLCRDHRHRLLVRSISVGGQISRKHSRFLFPYPRYEDCFSSGGRRTRQRTFYLAVPGGSDSATTVRTPRPTRGDAATMTSLTAKATAHNGGGTPNATNGTTTTTASTAMLRFVDIGANLLDERFTEGVYHGKFRHDPDLDHVLERAMQHGVTHIIVTAGTLEDSRTAVRVVRDWRARLATPSSPSLFVGCTVGVHPTRCQQEFVDAVSSATTTESASSSAAPPGPRTADDVLRDLLEVARDGTRDGCVVAIGEIGLDYDRLEFSPKAVQREFLRRQLDLFLGDGDGPHPFSSSPEPIRRLPLFLHNRSVGNDLLDEIRRRQQRRNDEPSSNTCTEPPLRGVVHSFDDTLELAQAFIDLGLYIGLNGCSLRTRENLDVVAALPLASILLATDCPYCEIKPTHAGYGFLRTSFEKRLEKKFEPGKMVKGRSEPCQIVQVAEVVAGAKGISVQEVADACYENTLRLYGWVVGDDSASRSCADVDPQAIDRE